MKILVMSDSHGERAVIENLKSVYMNQVDAIFHCGDSELSSEDKIFDGLTIVTGNCDYDKGYKEVQLKKVGSKNILVTHGHLMAVNFQNLTKLSRLANKEKADIVLFGHIHCPVAEIIDNRLFLNPGSIAQPRGEWNIKMYALIEWTDTVYKISYRDLNHRPIPQLQYILEVTHK